MRGIPKIRGLVVECGLAFWKWVLTPWALAIVKLEMNVVINLNIGRSQGLRGGVFFCAYSL